MPGLCFRGFRIWRSSVHTCTYNIIYCTRFIRIQSTLLRPMHNVLILYSGVRRYMDVLRSTPGSFVPVAFRPSQSLATATTMVCQTCVPADANARAAFSPRTPMRGYNIADNVSILIASNVILMRRGGGRCPNWLILVGIPDLFIYFFKYGAF